MGDRLIAASSAYKRAPADSSEPVLIDALPSLGRDLPDHSVRDDPTTLSRLRGSLTPQVLVAEHAVSVRRIMGHAQCGLTARLWRSCGSARKTSRIATSCRLCRRCNISRYRRTVCTAARSGTCDQRERGALPRRRRARRCCFRSIYFREPGGVLSRSRPTLQALPSTSRKRPWATRSSCLLGTSLAAPRSWRRCRRCADRRRGNASRGDGAAKFFSARLARGLFLLCAHGHEAIMSAHGDAEDVKRSKPAAIDANTGADVATHYITHPMTPTRRR